MHHASVASEPSIIILRYLSCLACACLLLVAFLVLPVPDATQSALAGGGSSARTGAPLPLGAQRDPPVQTAASSLPLLPAGSSRAALEGLYARYASELVELRQLGETFCSALVPEGFPHTHKCLSTMAEMELLYMRVREDKPAHVLEIASALGYTTMYLLAALARNDDAGHGGMLHSFDVFLTPFPDVLPAHFANHWHFTQGDVHQTFAPFAALDYGVILMDAEHTRKFGLFYRDTVLAPAVVALQAKADATGSRAQLSMTVHDVYNFECAAAKNVSVTDEGEVFLQWLGFLLPKVELQCWTANDIEAPRRFALLSEVQAAALGPANDIEFGQFPRGDLSVRCMFYAEPLPPPAKRVTLPPHRDA